MPVNTVTEGVTPCDSKRLEFGANIVSGPLLRGKLHVIFQSLRCEVPLRPDEIHSRVAHQAKKTFHADPSFKTIDLSNIFND